MYENPDENRQIHTLFLSREKGGFFPMGGANSVKLEFDGRDGAG